MGMTNGDEWRRMGRITVSYVHAPPPSHYLGNCSPFFAGIRMSDDDFVVDPVVADPRRPRVEDDGDDDDDDDDDDVHSQAAGSAPQQSDDQAGQKRKRKSERGVKMTPLARANQFKGDCSFFLWSAYLIHCR